MILPREGARGRYRVRPREIVHVDRKPDDAETGITRAEQRLRDLLTSGAKLGKRATLHARPRAREAAGQTWMG